MTRYAYGAIRDTPDHRDRLYAALSQPAALPPAVDLSVHLGPVFDQGQLGSCTANAIAGALMFCQRAEELPLEIPSRLWLYYQERALEGTIASDAGAQIRDGIKVVASLGCPPESAWPYDPALFAVAPPAVRLRASRDGSRYPVPSARG